MAGLGLLLREVDRALPAAEHEDPDHDARDHAPGGRRRGREQPGQRGMDGSGHAAELRVQEEAGEGEHDGVLDPDHVGLEPDRGLDADDRDQHHDAGGERRHDPLQEAVAGGARGDDAEEVGPEEGDVGDVRDDALDHDHQPQREADQGSHRSRHPDRLGGRRGLPQVQAVEGEGDAEHREPDNQDALEFTHPE